MVEFKLADTVSDYLEIERLAAVIWREHYIPIVGKPQVDYMLEKFQSANAVENQIADGFDYFIIFYEETAIGYLAIKPEENALFLSKIYVLSDFRGKKIGKKAIVFVEEKANEFQLNKIRLTVNINNTSAINAYEKLGFKNNGALVADIGKGFIMDDFEMVRVVVG
ncbi:GNAT family N-acetyltransferase [Tamlana sp. I1]|uniref:GNAT family N-acetyltransferase n=1 Tax=Tamlana sp. I1 TaxID=2762061 RepID=UPI00188DC82D|nr:GNAT family N-acetyltransferase [Tamlana sp. I1]